MEGNSPLYVTTLPGLVTACIAVVEIFLIYHVKPCDHVFKELCDLIG